jgi:Synergist-CTERM protein sorting domain-containing protein
MSVRKVVFAVLAVVLLFAGSAFAFPHDSSHSAINETDFPGDWGTTSSMNADTLRVFHFLDNEFKKGPGPGGSTDLKIWNTPSFSSRNMTLQENAWTYMLDHPGQTVPNETGRAFTSTHDEMVEFIEKLPRTNLTVEYLGEIPKGFPFPFLIFSRTADRTPDGLAATGKPLIWMQGNNHGGEWSGAESTLAMAYDLANGRYNDLLDKVNVLIIPRICADGAKLATRHSANLVSLQWTAAPSTRDLNRDNMLLDLPVLRAMRKMLIAYAPHFVCDMHERGSTNIAAGITNTYGLKVDNDAHDFGASGTILPQATKELIALRYDYLEPDLAEMGRNYGLYFGFYRDSTDPYARDSTSANLSGTSDNYSAGGVYEDARIVSGMVTNQAWDPDAPYFVIMEAQYNTRTANNITAMPGTVTQLFENKSGSGRGIWERRVATGYVCLLSTMTTAANRPEVIAKIKEIRKKNVEKGKTVTADDLIPILTIQPKPTYVNREWTVIDLGVSAVADPRDLSAVSRYDGTKALQKVAAGTGFNSGDYIPVKGTGSREHQYFKTEVTWQGIDIRERIRPYAYIFEGAQANELATRMMLAGIEVKRLAQDVTVDVEGWHYNKAPVVDNTDQGAGGWRNRDCTVFPIANRKFSKDTFVVYLAQQQCNLIPMYLEPDIPWSVGSCIYLPPMSAALGGAGNGWLSDKLIGVEMPMYRYLKTVDLPTYDINHFHPLVNRGAVARFFSYHTQEEIAAVADACGEYSIKVYDYDFQVHTRTDALVGGKFDITLPTSKNTKGYLILSKNGYQTLVPHSTMCGWNVATIVISDHGRVPFTINMSSLGQPIVGDGNNRTLPKAMPTTDDLIGVRIVEIVDSPITSLFVGGKLPPDAITTENGIEYTKLFTNKAVVLSNEMLDGWRILRVNPRSGEGWKADVINGEVVINFTENVYDKTVTVTLEKIGSFETRDIEITFSGENDRTGCNAGAAMLTLLALFPLFLRRKD